MHPFFQCQRFLISMLAENACFHPALMSLGHKKTLVCPRLSGKPWGTKLVSTGCRVAAAPSLQEWRLDFVQRGVAIYFDRFNSAAPRSKPRIQKPRGVRILFQNGQEVGSPG